MSTQINSKLLLASMNEATGDILYTFEWTYPRIILAEILTHRTLSRNTASSRAIPGKRQRGRVWDDPFVPTSIGAAQKGMQAGEELTGWRRRAAELVWRAARIPAVGAAWAMEKLGAHKQVHNRLVEPWTWTKQLVSATDLDNLFLLRHHEAAEPHFQELARQAHQQADNARYLLGVATEVHFAGRGVWQVLKPGEWHIPYIRAGELSLFGVELCKVMSAARCARVSNNLPDTGKMSSREDDVKLYARLAGSVPAHLSPLEHQAQALSESVYQGNFRGWKQFRKEVQGESGVAA